MTGLLSNWECQCSEESSSLEFVALFATTSHESFVVSIRLSYGIPRINREKLWGSSKQRESKRNHEKLWKTMKPHWTIEQDANGFFLSHVSGENVTIKSFSLYDLIPDLTSYLTYEGSLTIPGCYETVTWIIINKPVFITRQQVSLSVFFVVRFVIKLMIRLGRSTVERSNHSAC